MSNRHRRRANRFSGASAWQPEAGPGDIVVAAAGVAHKFTNDGQHRARLICIHAHPTTVTAWLE
jgi:mannose-6-phosphate isomerase-like protein (cupin superfamily)